MDESPTKRVPSGTTTPLQQLSPERINQLRMHQSPSIPAHLGDVSPLYRQHHRRDSDMSDVKSRVAFLNGLASAPGSPTRSPAKNLFTPSSQAAVQRAMMGREEAEAALTALTAQLEQSRSRERMVSERIESLMEQLQEVRARQRHERQVYEKEIKIAKKGEWKAELAVVQLQEQLKEIRSESEGIKVRAEYDKNEKEKARQEAFERAYVLAGLTEEVEGLKDKLKVVEREKDAAIAAAEASVASLAAPESEGLGQDAGSTEMQTSTDKGKGRARSLERPNIQKSQSMCDLSALPDVDPDLAEKYSELQEELAWVKSQLKREQDLVHFMNMQCQFKACPCRQAEKQGVRFVHDVEYDRQLSKKKRKAEDDLPLPSWISLKQRFQEQRHHNQEESTVIHVQEQKEASSETHLHIHEEPAVPFDSHDAASLQAVEKAQSFVKEEGVETTPITEAAEIPLPSPRSDDLEPTAVLEDFTQVVIEAETTRGTKPFTFSTSVSARKPADIVPLRHPQSQNTIADTDDLFDLAPPKRMPARPSTAMGILTVPSPVRLEPDSPVASHSTTPSHSPPHAQTVQVPLKGSGSPLRNDIIPRRSHSKPNLHVRSHSRGRSPGPFHDQSVSESPTSATLFPVTPGVKSTNSSQQHKHHAGHQTQTTTTMVPLRGMEEDDVFSPVRTDHAHTTQIEHESSRHPALNESSSSANDPIMVPGTPITREAALAQIRARRDRARSLNMRKAAEEEGSLGRKTPKSAAKRGLMLDRSMRDVSNMSAVSQASAPSRF